MKCADCGGVVVCYDNGVYYPDGSSSGHYECTKCNKRKEYFIKGHGEEIIKLE